MRQKSSSVQTRREFRIRSAESLEPRLVLAPVINEFMASNDSAFFDGDGQDSDWIELYNPTDSTIDLTGWHLTDNAGNLDKWTFQPHPSSTLSPGEYLVVVASGQSVEDYIDPLGFAHTDFKLSAGGEYLALTDPDENIIAEFGPEYPAQFTDVSYGFVTNIADTVLVGPANSTSALVPSDGSLDGSAGNPPVWTLPGFNDSSWDSSSSGVGVGFDTATDNPPGPADGTRLPGGLIGFDLTDSDEDGNPEVIFDAGGSDSSPSNEGPEKALDNTRNSKWLAFDPAGTFFEMQFEGGERRSVDAYTITSANDSSNRDPYTWTLLGSNDGDNYEAVDTRTAQDFSTRFQTRLYEFTNNTAYEYYRFEFLTEFGATGNNQPNSIQLAEIELLSSGELNYQSLIDVDVEDDWNAETSSVYQRVEFNVDDPSLYNSMLLEMQYDDGFIAYLNGEEIAERNAPPVTAWQSNATASHDDEDAVVPENFLVSDHLDALVVGENVLSIHLLNSSDGSSDLLSVPKLTVTQQLGTTEELTYMPRSTPGAPNDSAGSSFGPAIADVTDTGQPASNQSISITANVSATVASVGSVELIYRVNYGGESTIVMRDDGLGGDAVAGDGTFSATIPSSAYSSGQMVRWYVRATDIDGEASRMPQFFNPDASAEYFGTVVTNGVTSELPIFEYFVQSTGSASSRTGTRASVFYRGEFYDNVFIRRRGGNTTQGRKFEFNADQHFLVDPAYGRVDEINLNERGAEPTYMRQVLAWDVYAEAGSPASIGEAWHTRRNGSFLDVRIFVEQPDSDLLRRTGLDPEGAFYKIGDRGVENSVTSSTVGVKKRTRKNEDNSDLQALVDGVRPGNSNRAEYVWDNIDIAGVVNYLAATSIMHDNDHPHKNFHLYRDTEGSGQWTFIPWDKDLTFGLNFGLGGVIGNQDPYSHPFFGDTDHRKVDNKWNRMIDAVLQQPETKEMLVRRLRTLMDQFFGTSGTNSWLHQRVNELRVSMDDEIGGGSWVQEINRITGEYLNERRQHLYVNHSENNPGFPDNAGIPGPQFFNPPILISALESDPVSGVQNEEYIEFTNPNAFSVDISNWTIEGGIDHVFTPGTVIPAGGKMYISPDVPTFLARSEGPRGGMELFVQGNYSQNIGAGETIQLLAADGQLMFEVEIPGGGDFNDDGLYDCSDIDVLTSEIAAGTNNGDFDLNNDGLVDVADRDEWLVIAGDENLTSGSPYLLGDANLDGSVDVSDFNVWNSNKFTQNAAWCSGDFTADGSVDVSDFNAWNGNKFQSADSAVSFVTLPGVRTPRAAQRVISAVTDEAFSQSVDDELSRTIDQGLPNASSAGESSGFSLANRSVRSANRDEARSDSLLDRVFVNGFEGLG